MAVIKYTQEIKFAVAYKRVFKALTLEAHTLLPKVMPSMVKSIEMLGDGSPGTVRITTLVEGPIKHRLDALDVENCISKYSLIEGVWLGEKLESINYEAKFEESGDGGCVIKILSEYHTKGDASFNEEDIKAGKDQAIEFYTEVEKYLIANPTVCA